MRVSSERWAAASNSCSHSRGMFARALTSSAGCFIFTRDSLITSLGELRRQVFEIPVINPASIRQPSNTWCAEQFGVNFGDGIRGFGFDAHYTYSAGRSFDLPNR